jgi:hypothetical protein
MIQFPHHDSRDLCAVLLLPVEQAQPVMEKYYELMGPLKKGVKFTQELLWQKKISSVLSCIGLSVMTGSTVFTSVSVPDTALILALGWGNVEASKIYNYAYLLLYVICLIDFLNVGRNIDNSVK